jgi:hypothetical protein
MTGGVDALRAWCVTSDLSCRDDEAGHLLVRLDPSDRTEVRLEGPTDDEPLRLYDRVGLEVADLPPGRLAEVVEDVVLSRSSLVDARPTDDGRGAEVVVVVHAEGLNRHTFVEAVFELQKIRLLLQREVTAAVAAEHTVATLEAMAAQAWAADASA